MLEGGGVIILTGGVSRSEFQSCLVHTTGSVSDATAIGVGGSSGILDEVGRQRALGLVVESGCKLTRFF